MSKGKVLGAFIIVFLLLNVLPLPRGPQFNCTGGFRDRTQLYGFPFIYLQRSVSPSECPMTLSQGNYLGQHHVYPVKAMYDAATGAVVAVALFYWLERRKAG